MIAYLIKSVLCLLMLWGFYKIALEPLAANTFKRFYLLGSLMLSLTLPLITFSYTVEITPEIVTAPIQTSTGFEVYSETPVSYKQGTDWTPWFLGIAYLAGVVVFGFRFTRNILRLREKIQSNERVCEVSHTNVLLGGKIVPHSFLKYIFLPKTEFRLNLIAPEILAHEKTHVIQRHSWDILFIEFLQVMFWFNPLLYYFKKSVRLNHEFLADARAVSEKTSAENYSNLLFQYSGGTNHTALSSPINYSLTKKRILMLSKPFSAKKTAARLLILMPVLAFCLYFFNQDIVAKEVPLIADQLPQIKENTGYRSLETDSVFLQKKAPSDSQIKTWKNSSGYEIWVDKKGESQQNPPTQKEVEAYNAWAKKIHSKTTTISDNAKLLPIIDEQQLVKFSEIYNRMSPRQKNQSVEYPFPGLDVMNSDHNYPLNPTVKQEKATKKQVAEYNAWAKKINDAMKKAKTDNDISAYPIVKQKDYNKYEHIYKTLMSDKQRKNAEPWPSFPPPPPPATDNKTAKHNIPNAPVVSNSKKYEVSSSNYDASGTMISKIKNYPGDVFELKDGVLKKVDPKNINELPGSVILAESLKDGNKSLTINHDLQNEIDLATRKRANAGEVSLTPDSNAPKHNPESTTNQ